MRKLYKYSLVVFLRSKNLSIAYFILVALSLVYLVFCFNNYLEYNEIFSTLIWLVRPCIFLAAFFIYFSYELAIKMYDHNMVEYLKTFEYGLLKAYGAIILCLLTIIVLPAMMFSSFIIYMYHYIDVQYLPFLIHLVKLSVLYFGLLFVVGMMLGTAMAAKLKTKRLAVYSLTVIFMLLNTTFTDVPFRIPYLLFNSYQTEKMLYHIKDFLTVVPQELGNSFTIDPIYGFPVEPIRWILAVFWVLFPLTLILTECFNRKTKKALLATSSLILLLGVGLFSARGSTLIMDMRVNSYPFADPFYYMDGPREDYDGHEAGFIIEEYDMDLTISNELHAEVGVTIDNPDLDNYEFTLYHGYILASVHTEHGEIPFSRQGDHISIGNLNGADMIIFNYYGKSPKFYANRQAITLPGYFAYYPKAGRKNIWDLDQYGYVFNTAPNESLYTVNIKSGLEIFCNLAGSDNSFHGKSNGMSLFAGMYDDIDENIYAEPMRSDLPKREYINEAQVILIDIFNRLERPEPEALIQISDKRFFQVPQNFSLNSNTGDLVIMSDHITSISCNNGSELAMNIMATIIKPKSASDFKFRMNYLKYLFSHQDKSDPLLQAAVDLNLLLEEIDEWRSLAGKYSDMSGKTYEDMSDEEIEVHVTAERRMHELHFNLSEKTAKYLFHESPQKEDNMRIFFDYFNSNNEEDYLQLVEDIVKEDLEYDHIKKSEQAL